MKTATLDDECLDQARQRGDADADAVVSSTTPEPWTLSSSPPAWLNSTRVLRAQRFAQQHLLQITAALFYASLPTSYAAARGAAVLGATGRMSRDLDVRVNETARFILDVLEPGALETGAAPRVLRHVRIMHAQVRRSLRGSAPATEVPINQEDLLGTLCAFSVVVVRALRRMSVEVSPVEAEDYFHLWRGYGALLGIEEALLPADFAAAERCADQIARRQFAPSAAGRSLMTVLSDRIAAHVPFPGSTDYLVRRLAGDRVADVLGVPSDHAFREALVRLSRFSLLSDVQLHPLLKSATPLVARPLLDSIVRHKLGTAAKP